VRQDSASVYEPAEDTWLLLDALLADWDALLAPLAVDVVLEIGPGSGVVTTFLAQLYAARGEARGALRLPRAGAALSPPSLPAVPPPLFVAVDINPAACRTTLATASVNGVGGRVEAVHGSILACLRTPSVRPGV
jgi:release factor glutamine methyltransferase